MMQYTIQLFKDADPENLGQINFIQFENWIQNNNDIQEFLLKYIGVQTVGNAKRRYQEYLDIYIDIFNSYSFDLMFEEVEMMKNIKEIFDKCMPYIDKSVRENLYKIMD